MISTPPHVCVGCEAKHITIATLTAERDALRAKRDDLLDGHNKYSSDPTKGCVPMTDYLRVKKERDALRAKVADLEHDLADCRNGLANCH